MNKPTKSTEVVSVVIKKPNLKVVTLRLKGMTGLIVHRMLKEATVRGPRARVERNPHKEYEACFYKNEKGDYCIPGPAFKEALRYIAPIFNLKRPDINRSIWILDDLIPIQYQKKDLVMREDIVRLSGVSRAPDMRYRPEFRKWSVEVKVQFDADYISLDSLMNLFARAGVSAGVGEWRPSAPKNGGDHGMWEVESNVERGCVEA